MLSGAVHPFKVLWKEFNSFSNWKFRYATEGNVFQIRVLANTITVLEASSVQSLLAVAYL